MPKPGSKGHGMCGHVSDRLRQSHPKGTLPLPLAIAALDKKTGLSSTKRNINSGNYGLVEIAATY